jgi:hypothetical protein
VIVNFRKFKTAVVVTLPKSLREPATATSQRSDGGFERLNHETE